MKERCHLKKFMFFWTLPKFRLLSYPYLLQMKLFQSLNFRWCTSTQLLLPFRRSRAGLLMTSTWGSSTILTIAHLQKNCLDLTFIRPILAWSLLKLRLKCFLALQLAFKLRVQHWLQKPIKNCSRLSLSLALAFCWPLFHLFPCRLDIKMQTVIFKVICA